MGPATVMITGLAVVMESIVTPVLVIVVASFMGGAFTAWVLAQQIWLYWPLLRSISKRLRRLMEQSLQFVYEFILAVKAVVMRRVVPNNFLICLIR